MNRVSKETAAIRRKWGPIRLAYRDEFPDCMICGAGSECVHEIARGIYRRRAFIEPATWLSTCCRCNTIDLDNAKEWPPELQLAIKLLHDPTRFSLPKVNAVYGIKGCQKPPDRFDADDVLRALQRGISERRLFWPMR